MYAKLLLLTATVAAAAAVFIEPAAAAPDAVRPAASGQPVEFEVFLPLRHRAELDQLLEDQQNPQSPQYHRWLTPQTFAQRFGASPASLARVTRALRAAGLQVTAVHAQSLHVHGTAGAVERLFATRLNVVRRGARRERLMAARALTLPAALAAEHVRLAAFAPTPGARPLARTLGRLDPANRQSNVGPYWYNDLRQAYDYPSYTTPVNGQTLDGSGAHVAVLMSGDVLDSDIQAMFDHEQYSATTGADAPKLAARVYINGGAPFDANSGGSLEASLDVQQVIGGAPGAAVTLVDVPDLSDDNLVAGYLYIVESNTFDLVNSSFGGCEKFYNAEYNGGQDYSGILDIYSALFAQGNAEGITFVASSGDSGGLGCPDATYFSGDPKARPRFVAGIETPASDPHVTAVGGTNLVTTAPSDGSGTTTSLTSAYVGENAYGDLELPYDPYGLGINVHGGWWGPGGGVSEHFKAPAYQKLVRTHASMRTVPDVGMQVGGCPGGSLLCGVDRSSAVVALGGQYYGVIGTSVAAPEFVSALALDVQNTGGRLGNVNPFLYRQAALQNAAGGRNAPADQQFYHRNVPGYDGRYATHYRMQDYNYLTGNGTPDVRRLFGLTAADPAGDPHTPGNP
jgi:subtilase family serine protease